MCIRDSIENWAMFDERWLANTGQWGAVETVDFVGERLGLRYEDGLRDRLLDTFRIAAERADLTVAPNLEACLRTLRDAGLRIGIVCDVGLTAAPVLRDRLETFGLLRYFDSWSFSDETGCFKPAPEAFRRALDGMEVEPADAAHVGDLDRTDVAGALGLGMIAVQYLGLRDRPPGDSELVEVEPSTRAHHVLHDHAELPAALGI